MCTSLSHYCSGESANAKEFARISQLDLTYEEGRFVLRAPDRPPLTLDPSDLEPSADRMVSMKLYDIYINVLLLGTKYDDYVTEFVTGGDQRIRMVYHYSRQAQRPVRPVYRRLWPDTFKDGDVTTLNDQTPFTVLSWASVHRLNQ